MKDFENILNNLADNHYELYITIDKENGELYRFVVFQSRINKCFYILQFSLDLELIQIYIDNTYDNINDYWRFLDKRFLSRSNTTK